MIRSDATRKIILIVDNLRVHRAKIVSAWLEDKKDRIELAFLPPYAPESNPDEYLNSDLKTNLRLGPVSENREQLLEKTNAFMNKLLTWPERVQSYFQHPCAQYASNPICVFHVIRPGISGCRGRDKSYLLPPAQIHAGRITARGSCQQF